LIGRRLAALALGLTGLAAPGGARTIPAEQAPADWLAYAHQATTTITGWINGQEGLDLRATIDTGAAGPADAQTTLIVMVWVDRHGALTRAEFANPASPPAMAAGLQKLLVGRQLTPPPRKMRLPMRLALGIAPKQTPAATI